MPSPASPYRTPASLAALCLMAMLPLVAFGQEDDWYYSGPGAEAVKDPSFFARTDTAYPGKPPAVLPLAIARRFQALKARANLHYRAKRFAEACRIYGEASLLDSSDAAIRNDLGICLQNLGKKDSALLYTREALRLADRSLSSMDTTAWSLPDLRARKTAYYNLDRLGGPMPEPRAGQCETWSGFSSCRSRLYVCAEAGKRPIREGVLHWDILRLGVTRGKALFNFDEVEVPSLVPNPEMRDMEELALDGVPESRSRWLNRDSSVTIPLGEMLETADPACVKDCGRLEKVRSECRVIHFDPCAGVVGVACGIEEGAGTDRVVISEFYLLPAR